MKNVFFISDTHFGHKNICNFTKDDGSKLRPWNDVSEMDEALVENWNSVVNPSDKIYHLGDVCLGKKHLEILSRLNGKKILIRGNHDIFEAKEYMKYFNDIRGVHVMNGMILSHIPIHDGSLERFSINVHGHLHSNRVIKDGVIDPRYYSVCVEQIKFTPIELGVLRENIKLQGGSDSLKTRESVYGSC